LRHWSVLIVIRTLTTFGTVLFASAGAVAQDQIIVTGERRAEAAEAAPASISAIGANELRLVGADHIAEALSRAAGVNLHRGSGAEHLTAIRSPVLTGGAGAGSFLFLENGVPLRSAGFANINGLFDAHHELAERIEVVRGPSGALYGANAIHGVVNVVTPAPGEDFSVIGEIFGDTEDRYKWKGAVSGTSGAHGLYAGASVVTESGYREDAGLDQQKAMLRHVYSGDAISVDTIFAFDNLEQETAGFIFGRADLFDRARRRTNSFPQAFRDAKSARLQSTIAAQLSDRSELRITPYARWNDMDFLQHFLPGNALEENGHWSVGVQSAYYYDADRFSFIAGVDAEVTEGWLTEFQEEPTVFSFTQGLHYDYDVRAINASGFAEAEFALTGRTTLTVAVRIDGAVYDYENNTSSGVDGRFFRPADRTDRFVTASPKVSLRHDLSQSANIYASYARGARPPQTSDLYRLQSGQTDNAANPEIIDALEIGARARVSPRIQLNAAAFWMAKRNFFFRDADGFNVNDGKTRHLGVEAETTIRLLDTLTLSSAVTYAAHTYQFDRNPAATPGVVRENITSGDDVDTAPRVIANTRLQWRPVEAVRLEAEWRSIGAYFTDAANNNEYEGYDLLNLRAEAEIARGIAAFLTLRNATNALYAERADFAFGNDRFFPGETRTLGFGVRLRR